MSYHIHKKIRPNQREFPFNTRNPNKSYALTSNPLTYQRVNQQVSKIRRYRRQPVTPETRNCRCYYDRKVLEKRTYSLIVRKAVMVLPVTQNKTKSN